MLTVSIRSTLSIVDERNIGANIYTYLHLLPYTSTVLTESCGTCNFSLDPGILPHEFPKELKKTPDQEISEIFFSREWM